MSRAPNANRQPWIVSALLFALIVRAFVPAGFMPAAGFSFQICPDGFPAHMLRTAASAAHTNAGSESGHAEHHHHHHSEPGAQHDGGVPQDDDGTPHRHASAGSEHCAFAAAGGPALLAWTPTFSSPITREPAPEFVYVAPAPQLLRFRIQQPRGPPALS